VELANNLFTVDRSLCSRYNVARSRLRP